MIASYKNPNSYIGQHVLVWEKDTSTLPEWYIIKVARIPSTVIYTKEEGAHTVWQAARFTVVNERDPEDERDVSGWDVYSNWTDWYFRTRPEFEDEDVGCDDTFDSKVKTLFDLCNKHLWEVSQKEKVPNRLELVHKLNDCMDDIKHIWRSTKGMSECGKVWKRIHKKRVRKFESMKARTLWAVGDK